MDTFDIAGFAVGVVDKKKILRNANRLGVKKVIIEDLKNVFVKDYVFPMIRAYAVYEGI